MARSSSESICDPKASNELNRLLSDITDNLKQEKEIDDGIVYRGEFSMVSNFFPAQFTLDGVVYAHVEQYYQHMKATHHNETEIAEDIMYLTSPLRIKTLGDGIESNASWMERRMLFLYDGVRAKFEQNIPLQEELLSTQGKHLYEATTDTYFGCGLGFDSKRWQQKDWIGENIAGLILKKVRDEFLGIQPEGKEGNNTLIDIASQDDVCSSSEMDFTGCSEGTDVIPVGVTQTASKNVDCQSQVHDVGSEPVSSKQYPAPVQDFPYRGRNKGRSRGRGQGRGRGKNHRYYQDRNYQPYNNRNPMSEAERNFLGIKGKHRSTSNARSSQFDFSHTLSQGSNHKVWPTLT